MYYGVTVPLLILCSANINLNIFIGYDPLHRCRLNDDYNVNWTAVQAHAAPSKQIIPGKTVFDACNVYSW